MSVDLLDVQRLDTHCDCGCQNCERQKQALVELAAAVARSKRTTVSERVAPSTAVGPAGGVVRASSRRPRGQQRGEPGHGRRRYDHLPVGEEVVVRPAAQELLCGDCGLPLEEFSENSSEELHLEIVVTRRVVRRPAYRPTCRCRSGRALVQAPAPPKLIPKGLLTVETVAWLLILKFELATPVQRIQGMLMAVGLNLAPGTVAGVFQQVAPMLEALAERIRERTRQEAHLHSDETGWRLLGLAREASGRDFAWLWVLVGPDSVSFMMARCRSTAALAEHLGLDPEQPHLPDGRGLILSSDRYSGNMSLYRQCPEIVPALCWAHVRRDFWERRHHPRLGPWVQAWLERIGALFKAHRQWRECPGLDGSPPEQERHAAVLSALGEIETALDGELADENLEPAARKILVSLDAHWLGLQTTTELRWIPPDNNAAERVLRTPVIVERNCLGSAAEWSAKMAADLWTVIFTAKKAGWNTRRHLADYLEACRLAEGPAPGDLDRFLPWTASSEDRQRWCLQGPDSS